MTPLSLIFGAVVGLSLGLTGGGGAIFAVPLLVYGLRVDPREAEEAQAKDQSMQTYVSIGSAVIGAIFGRKKLSSTTIGKAATSMRSASRAARQQADVAHAEESLQSLDERRRQIETDIEQELEMIRLAWSPEAIAVEPIEIPARKTDTTVEDVVLAWLPRALPA
jgi:hypothetical protein